MKRILKDAQGRKVSLNTETADLVHEFAVSTEGADPTWERAALYRTRNADFFKCGRSGSEAAGGALAAPLRAKRANRGGTPPLLEQIAALFSCWS